MDVRSFAGATALALTLALTVPVISPQVTAEAHEISSGGDLRVALNQLLSEHVVLAAAATNAALAGRSEEFEAAASALDKNSIDIAGAIGMVYGKGAQEAFLPLWRKHIGFFVDYTNSVAKMDDMAKKKAVDDLIAYASDFGAFLNSANKRLPKEAVAELVMSHVTTLAAVVDAQAAKDWKKAYMAEREAFSHMQHIADALADAISRQFPKKFGS